ncbi:MAG: hypothetical protein UT12_C0010G0018 [Candidatus Curtissbacteria bacterium GW2011_GWC2_38_9]|uniref:Corrinoid adenosyltransferase n=3 Tax=Candidatus Curtissiibacteriota TaxID=1752717 RepID=A0A0G0LF41_9BACT|nr:MAG: hypothetical protein UT12_C0010G0018 [Candidatus Curtissbacteria bacterium GW2011_GWC2_38_9]
MYIFASALIYNLGMKIYTKTGDSGTTSLFGGRRVGKDSARIAAYGTVDELNSLIGLIISDLQQYSSSERSESRSGSRPASQRGEQAQTITDNKKIVKKLLRIQSELFVLGADLATPADIKIKAPRIKKSFVIRLEREIDKWSASLPVLKNFILPGGGKVGSKLHLARSIARRAEWSLVALSKEETINKNTQMYINRLSDWFFVAARHVNKGERQEEKVWRGRG